MNLILAAAVYFILFWLCLFMVLPIGVRSVGEAGDGDAHGHDRGAPVAPNLGKKVLWAAGGALVLLAIIVAVLQAFYYGKPLS